MLMHSFSSNAIFHACDNLKMRQNLPAETIQIGVTEVQVRQTYFRSGTFNLSTFHNMRFNVTPAASR